MLARIRKSIDEKDSGFTLIELLVVMIIIGILAAIAVPVFMNQQKKAKETAAKSDVSSIGKSLAAYWVDATAIPPTAELDADGKVTTPGIPAVNTASPQSGISIVIGADTIKLSRDSKWVDYTAGKSDTWCAAVQAGDGKIYTYSATGGMAEAKNTADPCPAAP